jgi:hypothetical protein
MSSSDELVQGMVVPMEQQLLLQRIQMKKMVCTGLLENGSVLVRTSEGDVAVQASPVSAYRSIEEYRRHLDLLLEAAKSRKLPDDWYKARRGLRIVLEAASSDVTGIVHKSCGEGSDQGVVAVLIYTDLLEQRVSWVTTEQLERWGVEEEEAWDWAAATMGGLLRRTEVQQMNIDGHIAGMLVTPSSFKAGLLLAPGIKEQLKAQLGWPLTVAIPSWDAVYLLPPESEGLVPDLKRVVQRDIQSATRPVSHRLLILDDTGLHLK